jgi:FkbM family methyltransferase
MNDWIATLIGVASGQVLSGGAMRSVPLWLRDNLPAPLSLVGRKAWRFARAWRQYRDGLWFDLFEREYQTDDLRFEIPREHTRLQDRARFRTDTHEIHERRLVKRFLPSEACVLDLGACLGVVSVVANHRLRDRSRHVVVEPNPEIIPVLTRNRDRNGARFRIEQALVSRDSDGTFYVCDCPTMSSAHKATGRSIRVPVLTVEEIEARHKLRFDALVMDIQGGEHAFFEENRELIARCRCVVLEFHPHIIGERRCEESRALMRAAGLRQVAVSGLVEAWCR